MASKFSTIKSMVFDSTPSYKSNCRNTVKNSSLLSDFNSPTKIFTKPRLDIDLSSIKFEDSRNGISTLDSLFTDSSFTGNKTNLIDNEVVNKKNEVNQKDSLIFYNKSVRTQLNANTLQNQQYLKKPVNQNNHKEAYYPVNFELNHATVKNPPNYYQKTMMNDNFDKNLKYSNLKPQISNLKGRVPIKLYHENKVQLAPNNFQRNLNYVPITKLPTTRVNLHNTVKDNNIYNNKNFGCQNVVNKNLKNIPLPINQKDFGPNFANYIQNLNHLKNKYYIPDNQSNFNKIPYNYLPTNRADLIKLSEKKINQRNVFHSSQANLQNIPKIQRKYNFIGVEQVDPNKYISKYDSELVNNSKLPNFEITSWAYSNKNKILPHNTRLVSKNNLLPKIDSHLSYLKSEDYLQKWNLIPRF
jgi:hypothetical protein